jgi:glyoxylase-like metal-dependent hydrolase (beta-lactamase superfamily II)
MKAAYTLRKFWATPLALIALFLAAICLVSTLGAAGPAVQPLGQHLYAYISDNDGSANSTFLVGLSSILVVDSGLNRTEGEKLLHEIRKISPLPIAYIINTHYHPDHQGGNGVFGSEPTIISSPFTREKTIALAARMSQGQSDNPGFQFRPATMTIAQKLTIYMGDEPVEIIAAWPGHTMGDVYVYFPNERAVATGDLYLTNAVPAMDEGSAAHWIEDLDGILALPADHFVPGHFGVGTKQRIQRFRDYMADLYSQVQQMAKAGASEEEIRKNVKEPNFSDFKQYPKYEATFGDNAVAMFKQIRAGH